MSTKRLLAKACAVTLLLSAAIVEPPAASAQSDPNFGNPTLLNAIKQLQDSVASLQSQLNQVSTNVSVLSSLQIQINQITTSLAALTASASGNRVVTPAVFGNSGGVDGNFILCNVANVSTSPKHVKIDAVRGKDQVVFPIMDGSQPLAAGFADGFPPALGGQSGFFYCRFTVLDGVASDIRGTVQSLNSGVPPGNIAVPAQ